MFIYPSVNLIVLCGQKERKKGKPNLFFFEGKVNLILIIIIRSRMVKLKRIRFIELDHLAPKF